jgi:hypothetical protein
MSVDKPLEPLMGESAAEVTIDVVNPDAVTIETEDGGAIVILGPRLSDEVEPDFGANLAEHIDDSVLSAISQELVTHFENDLRSRADWEKTYKSGLDLLGLKIEDRSTPWAGACGVFHPILSEAAVRFQSQSIMETFPAGGPVRTKIAGKVTPEKEKQAIRVKEDLNYFLTDKMSEYRSEHERLLFNLPLAGAAFKKVYYDPSLGRPVAMFVPAEDLVAPYGASDLVSCPRYTHIMYKYPNELKKLQVSGFYRDIDLPEPVTQISQIQNSKNELTGETEANSDDRHQLLEMHVELDIEGFEDLDKDGEPTGIALPYVVTIDRQSGLVLSIYRNWRQDDSLKLKRMHFVQYGYVPGFGFYAFGLIHLIGGIAKSATSILRQLVDAGTLANLPAGLKARGLRIKGDSTPLMPGEFRDVDVPSGAIKDAITFLPYKEPSQVLAALLGTMVEEGRRFASIADLQIGDSNQQAPVGTTLALMERAMKVMSAVQARLHASLAQELDILVEIIKTHAPDEYEYETDPGATRGKDYDDRVDVIPVTDPNAASLSQRVVQYQAALQLAAQAPNMYDLPELHRQMLAVLGINDIDKIIPSTKDKRPADPISENMDILNGKPVNAFIYQDHEAHIQAHMSAMQNPRIMALVGQNPMAGGIQAAMMAHINEHIAFQYRREIEEQLGVQLPEPNAELPEDAEVMLSKLVAEASNRLLAKDQAEAQQQQIQQQMQDPVVQAQMQDAQNKAMEVQRKIAKDQADNMAKADQRQIERDRIASQERIAGVNAGIKASNERDKIVLTADKNKADARLAGFKAGQEAMRNFNGSV